MQGKTRQSKFLEVTHKGVLLSQNWIPPYAKSGHQIWVIARKGMSLLRPHAVRDRQAELRFRFTMLLTVSTCQRCP
jgi:hypothetical protein